MKRVLLSLVALLVGGCATPEPTSSSAPRVLVALHLAGGGVPTPQQVSIVLQAITPVMAKVGFQLADRVERADYILSATLTPDAVDPDGGRLAIQGFEPTHHGRGSTANPTAAKLKEMQDRVENLERWALRAEIGR